MKCEIRDCNVNLVLIESNTERNRYKCNKCGFGWMKNNKNTSFCLDDTIDLNLKAEHFKKIGAITDQHYQYFLCLPEFQIHLFFVE